ncbi:Hypothetical protein DHA2_153012, partial [Giardia duodenalis]
VNNALSFGAVAKALRALDETPMRPPEGYVGLDYPPSMSSTGWSGNRRRNEEGSVWNSQQEGLRRVWPRAGPAQGDEAERQLREIPHAGV